MRFLLVVVLVAGCSSPPPVVIPPVPPQVFLTLKESNVFGVAIEGTTNVSGCKTVTQVQILTDNDAFLADANYKGANSPFVVPAQGLAPYYNAKGIALNMSLWAKVVCDDGRTNKSQPVSVSFFPVESVLKTPTGQALPDVFVAEGGFGGTPTTFVGCVAGTNVSVMLARVDVNAEVTMQNESLPFPCSINSQISDKSRIRQTRWLLEPGVGAFAFDTNLNITAVVTGPLKRMGISGDGDAIFFSDETAFKVVKRATSLPADKNQPVVWQASFPNIMNSTPVVDTGNRVVYTSYWELNTGTNVGDIVALKYNYDTGTVLNPQPDVILRQTFAALNTPFTPTGAFTPDGFLALPLVGTDITTGNVKTAVVLCSTLGPNCENATRKWTSDFFNGIVSTVVPFGAGGYLFAAGPYQTWFLSTQTGKARNLNAYPTVGPLSQDAAIRPTGSLITLAVQPGIGSDVYVLNGPNLDSDIYTVDGTGARTAFATEIVGLTSAEDGEIIRISFGSGTTPNSGMYLATDDSGQFWLRVGNDQVKPLPMTEYRAMRR